MSTWLPWRRIARQVILEVDLEPGLLERRPGHPLARLRDQDKLTLPGLVQVLARAATDPRVVALVVRLGAGGFGLARVEEVRDAVRSLREAGKHTVAFSETMGEAEPGHGGYYLSTAFDEVWLQPSGSLGLTGLLAAVPFAREGLDRLGLRPLVDRRREYKTASNLFTEDGLTDPHREMLESVVGDIFDRLVGEIATARELDRGRVRELVGSGPIPAGEALETGLVDHLGYRDELDEALEDRFGKAQRLDPSGYLSRAGRPFRKGRSWVAIIQVTGLIQRGPSYYRPGAGSITGSDSIRDAFRDAVKNPRVKAILLRVDSPGGSYVGSDLIHREVVRARAQGKPVIVSMGNAAASGGYFIAAAADRIVAQPSTLTGSIGVVYGKVVTRDLWERLGVRWDEVRQGGNAGMWSTLHEYSDDEWERLQHILDQVYEDFTDKVGRGRSLDRGQVEEVARGRVWTGNDARRLKLVDESGGMLRAFLLARQAADLPPEESVRLEPFPRPRSLLRRVMELAAGRGPQAFAARRGLHSFAAGRGAEAFAAGLSPELPLLLEQLRQESGLATMETGMLSALPVLWPLREITGDPVQHS